MEAKETEELRRYCVYLITCLVNGKQYVGQTGQGAKKRWTSHKSEARSGKDLLFYHAIRKHGEQNFVLTVLRDGLSKKEADDEERLAIKTLCLTDDKFGYNIKDGGAHGLMNAEGRRKISEKAKDENIKTEEIASLYQTMSMSRVANKLGISHRTVGRRLLEAREPIRSMSESLILSFGLNISNEEINRLYHEEKMNSVEIAEKFGVDSTTIRKRLDDYGDSVRTRSDAQALRRGVNLTDEELNRLYWAENMSTPQIAEKFGISWPAVRYRMKKAGIPRRTISEAALLERKTRRNKCQNSNSAQKN